MFNEDSDVGLVNANSRIYFTSVFFMKRKVIKN